MKKRVILVICMLFASSTIYAKNSAFVSSVALVGMAMDYKEYNTAGVLVDSEESDVMGIGGAEMSLGYIFDATPSSYNQVSAGLTILSGETTYKGSILGSGNPYGSYAGKTQNIIIDMDIVYKRAHRLSSKVELDYGLGLGYRSWERALSALQIETYKWYSLRPMLGGKFYVSNKVDVGLFMEYQFGINPTMSETTQDFTFDLGGADILEISLPITYKYNESMDMFFEYTYQKQTIKKSKEIPSGIYVYYEPDTTAHNQYLKLGAAFKF